MATRHTILLIILSVIITTGCGKKTEPENAEQPIMLGTENVAVALQQQIESGPSISGTLSPKKAATMRAQVAGAVLQTYADQGQRVGQGAMLARLDERAISDAVTSARSALSSAQNALEVAQRDKQRVDTLKQVGAISDRDLDNATRSVTSAQAMVEQARSQLSAAQKQLAYTKVQAPFSGVVSAKSVSTGDIVQPGTPLFTIVDPSSMELKASIPPEDLTVVSIGTQVQFSVSGIPDKSFNGTITRISPTADPATRQVTVFAEIPNTSKALVGDLFAQGRITADAHAALTVPTSAIDRRMMKPVVAKLEHGRTKRVEVTLGVTDHQTDRIEITSGLSVGDTVLTGPAIQITEGTPVQITVQHPDSSVQARTAP